MNIHVKYFAAVAETAGCEAEIWTLDEGSTSDDLLRAMKSKYAGLHALNCRVAFNQRLVNGAAQLSESAEIAVLPPFSGG